MTNETHREKMQNELNRQALVYLRKLRREYARMLIKLCDGNMCAALNAILKAYGHEYGTGKEEVVTPEKVTAIMECACANGKQ